MWSYLDKVCIPSAQVYSQLPMSTQPGHPSVGMAQ